MNVTTGSTARVVKAAIALVGLAAVATLLFSATASAAPGAYKILLAEVYELQPQKLRAQIVGQPEVAQVDTVDTGSTTPTAAQLANYDEVVSIGDSDYLDASAWGDSLAAFIDGGGVVVQSAYDNWEEDGAHPSGRFESGGYAPFVPGPNENENLALGTFDSSNPLMAGVNSLTSNGFNTEPELAPGAQLVASWNNGSNAVAVKGRVLSISAWIGDEYGDEAWDGDYGRLVLNAVRTLGPKPPQPVIPPPPAPPAPATCKVPNLAGKKLRASKRAIRAAGCKVGEVTKRKGVTAKAGKVVHQGPKAGRVLAAGTEVRVRLG